MDQVSSTMETASSTGDAAIPVGEKQETPSDGPPSEQPSNLEDAPPNAEAPPPTKKPFSFYMSILCLAFIVLVVSWDATSLAVAIPV